MKEYNLTDKGKFWNNKILDWEDNRYNNKVSGGILERIAMTFNSSLLNRQNIAISILKKKLDGKRVLELGCGSGIFANRLFRECNLKSYIGLDISPNALKKARESENFKNLDADFYYADLNLVMVKDLNIKYDYVVSLGLLDWMDLPTIDRLFNGLYDDNSKANHLHSFSEKRNTMAQYFHSLYVRLKYGNNNDMYVPRYYTEDEIKGALSHYFKYKEYTIKKDTKMSFSAFLMSNF